MPGPLALVRAIAALALPPRCPACGVVVDDDHRFCGSCWRGLRFLAPPWCAGCNLPFATTRDDATHCARCLADPPRHAGVRAAVAYGPMAGELALRLKYGGRLAVAETMARLMARHLPDEPALLVPVPLHPRRLWMRGYNQAGLIAQALARGRPHVVATGLLVRTRATPALRGLGRRERATAVRGAFSVRNAGCVRGRSIVLVDDVHTTGATADACVAALRRAGAESVLVLCWARVVGGEGGGD